MTRIFIFLYLSIISYSCKKYLDAKPDKALVVPTSINDLQALLDNSRPLNELYPTFDEASADDYFLSSATYTSFNSRLKSAYSWELTDYSSYPNDWSYIYDVVQIANVVLDNLSKIEQANTNQTDWDNVKGSALFLRAKSFLKAAFIFSVAFDDVTADSDLGIPIRITSDYNVKSNRSSVRQTYDKIIQDLKEASDLLPVSPKHVMRPSKKAAYGLLARAYLSMRKYDSAYQYSNLCLGINFQLMDYNSKSTSSNTPFARFNEEVIYDNIISQFSFSNINPSNARVDSTLFQSYSNNDLRKALFFRANTDGSRRFKGAYTGNATNLFVGIAIDEILLIRSECSARMGNITDALNDLNSLLKKRWKNGFYIPFTATTTQEALNIILVERRKELLFRGLRWIDIKRLNKEGANINLKRIINNQIYLLTPNDNKYALPLPSDIVNMTGMPQNPR